MAKTPSTGIAALLASEAKALRHEFYLLHEKAEDIQAAAAVLKERSNRFAEAVRDVVAACSEQTDDLPPDYGFAATGFDETVGEVRIWLADRHDTLQDAHQSASDMSSEFSRMLMTAKAAEADRPS